MNANDARLVKETKPMTATSHTADPVFLAYDVVGSIQISTIAEVRGETLMGHEIAIWTPVERWTVIATFWEEERAEALAAHALLVEQLGAMM